MLHAVIMAGGSGTRFWPASRRERPKQLLRMLGERSMIQETVDRLGDLVPVERMLVATNARLAEPIRRQLPQLPEAAILCEPCKRDTAPCIGLAAVHLLRHDDEATMLVLPADHVIGPPDVFCDALAYAASLIDDTPRRLVTLGILPTYAAESFGYIERGDSLVGGNDRYRTYAVARFREKPPADVAEQYLASGKFYWNAGIFLWRARRIMQLLAEHQPAMHAHLEKIAAAIGTPHYHDVLRREFAAIEGTSIDYAVMEHAPDVVVVESPFRWDDLGNWRALARLRGTDEQGNTLVGRHLAVGTRGSIVHSDDKHLVAVLGLDDVIVVHTPDATLVANKHDEEQVRRLVKLLEERGWEEYL